MSEDRHWMQHADRHPGAFRAYAERHGLSMSEAIQRGKHSRNPTTRRRANLAATFRKFRKHKR